ADALNEIAGQIWWAKPLYWLSGVAMVKSMLRLGYRWVARNRACLGGSCSRQVHLLVTDFILRLQTIFFYHTGLARLPFWPSFAGTCPFSSSSAASDRSG